MNNLNLFNTDILKHTILESLPEDCEYYLKDEVITITVEFNNSILTYKVNAQKSCIGFECQYDTTTSKCINISYCDTTQWYMTQEHIECKLIIALINYLGERQSIIPFTYYITL